MSPTVHRNTAQRAPAITALTGAALALLGSFLDWATLESGGASESVTGLAADGLFTLVLSVVAAGLLTAGLLTGRTAIGALATVPGLVVLAFGILSVIDTDRLIRAQLESQGGNPTAEQLDRAVETARAMVDVSPSIGLWAVLLGGVAMAVCPVIVGLTPRPRR